MGVIAIHNSFSLLLLPPHAVPLLQRGPSTGCSFLQGSILPSENICFIMVLSGGCRGISASVPRAPSLPPSSLTLVFAGLFPTHFSHSSLSTASQHYLPFLKYMFSEALHPWLRCSAVSWKWVGWNRLCSMWEVTSGSPPQPCKCLGTCTQNKGLGKNYSI